MAKQNDESDRVNSSLVKYAEEIKSDLYALLDLSGPGTSSPSSADATFATAAASSDNPLTDQDIQRAWRRAALRHHPDKNRGNEEAAADRYDAAKRASEVLLHPEARAAYDLRRAKERNRRQRDAALEGRRRKLKEDLDMRESHAGWGNGAGAFGFSAGSKRNAQGEVVESPAVKRER